MGLEEEEVCYNSCCYYRREEALPATMPARGRPDHTHCTACRLQFTCLPLLNHTAPPYHASQKEPGLRPGSDPDILGGMHHDRLPALTHTPGRKPGLPAHLPGVPHPRPYCHPPHCHPRPHLLTPLPDHQTTCSLDNTNSSQTFWNDQKKSLPRETIGPHQGGGGEEKCLPGGGQ